MAQLVVPDERVSSKHVQVRFDASIHGYRVKDLNSTNGSYLNDAKLSGELPLPDQSLISVGNSRLFFDLRDFPDPQTALASCRDATVKPADVH
jgi:pSer/pThr/pTyr-binding forkhead associated (FHA) protein